MTRASCRWWLVLLATPLTALAATHSVTISGTRFQPDDLTIQVGDTVVFSNPSGIAHNVVADDGSFRCSTSCVSGGTPGGSLSAANWSSSRVFATAGDVGYYCDAHGAPGGIGMAGIIRVQGASAPPADISLNAGLTGSWFNPATNGQGFEFEVVPGFDPPLFVFTWFTFDTAPGGETAQRWYTGAGGFESGATSVAVTIQRTTGGVFDQSPPAAQTTAIGQGSFRFDSCTSGSFSYTLNLPQGTLTGEIPLARITPDVFCETLLE